MMMMGTHTLLFVVVVAMIIIVDEIIMLSFVAALGPEGRGGGDVVTSPLSIGKQNLCDKKVLPVP